MKASKTYKVEELHRGKWIPLLNKNDEQRIVRITERTAEVMNRDIKSTKERYVLVEGSDDSDDNNIPTMENTKAEIVVYLNDNEIEIPSEATTKAQLLALIVE